MRTLTFALVFFAGVGLALPGCTDKSQSVVAPTDQVTPPKDQGTLAKVGRTDFTATDTPIDVTNSGDVKGNGQRTIIKWQAGHDYVAASDPRVTGVAYLVVSGAVDQNFEGQAHGTFTITPDVGGGIWVGTWEGNIKDYVGHWKMVGQGKGGDIDGMQLFATEVYAVGVSGELEGYIQSH